MAYPARRVVRHDGAYTWHRAGLSEEHALRAIGGVMQITTPAGERLQFRYERHVEHASGDWTWIGRAKDGAASDEVVLTFGEHAVFGSISQPGQAPLRLTMSGGVSWVIETDSSKIADIDNSATRPRKPDFLIPPKLKPEAGASAKSAPVTAALTAESALPAAPTTVDLLLGYTSGFADAQGGQSQAVTRLNNMVEITNQAYANSQIAARIRLVHAMQVSYPDNTSNRSALEALTGFKAPSTRMTPDPAFAALRSARDQYGADLVSLVRKFQTPENDGCGSAWLIGSERTGIYQSDAFFGYSVLSDGRDADIDGKTYFCRDETMAHELGHNMGSAHDVANSKNDDGSLSYGVYDYSFGYRTDFTLGNFYTVMAYGDSGQVKYRVFSDPRTNYCGGYPCGVEGSSDNARSLVQTMPVVATFRATIVPEASRVRADFNGDGKSDIFWNNPVLQRSDWWLMNGPSRLAVNGMSVAAQYRVAALADFDGDGRSDVLWEDGATIWLWRSEMAGGFSVRYVSQHLAGAWKIVGVGDLNGDGKADIVWNNPVLQRADWWLMDGASVTSVGSMGVSNQYSVAAVDDYNGDGRSDVLWRDSQTMWIWRSEPGGSFSIHYIGSYPAGDWRIVGTGDFNGDAKADIFWNSQTLQQSDWWLMDGASRIGFASMGVPRQYQVAAVADYDGDGRSDVLWQDGATIWIWRSEAAGSFSIRFVDKYPPVGWSIMR